MEGSLKHNRDLFSGATHGRRSGAVLFRLCAPSFDQLGESQMALAQCHRLDYKVKLK